MIEGQIGHRQGMGNQLLRHHFAPASAGLLRGDLAGAWGEVELVRRAVLHDQREVLPVL